MEYTLALTFENKTEHPFVLSIEPKAEDFTLLPGEIAEIWQHKDDYYAVNNQPPTLVYYPQSVTIYAFSEFDVRVNGESVSCGYQRNHLNWITYEFDLIVKASAKEFFKVFHDTRYLQQVIDHPIEKVFDRFWRYKTKDGELEWTNIIVKNYHQIHCIWRAGFMAGTERDAHAQLNFSDVKEGTKISVSLSSFEGEDTKNNAIKLWENNLLEPLKKLLEQKSD